MNLDRAFTAQGFSFDDQVGLFGGSDHPSLVDTHQAPVGSFYFQADGDLFRKVSADTWEATPVMRLLTSVDGKRIPSLMFQNPSNTDQLLSAEFQTFQFYESKLTRDEFMTDAIGLVRHVMPFDGVIIGAQVAAESVSKDPVTIGMVVDGVPAGELPLAVQGSPQVVSNFDLAIPFNAGSAVEAKNISTGSGVANQAAGICFVRWRFDG